MRLYVCMLLIGVVSCRAVAPASHDAVNVSATVVQENNDPALRFQVTNDRAEPLVVVDRFLPWGGNAANWGDDPALEMKAIDSRGRELAKLYPVRELGPDARTTIPPRTTVDGTLRLTHYFADLRETLKSDEVKVEWTYRLKPVDGPEQVFRGQNELTKQ